MNSPPTNIYRWMYVTLMRPHITQLCVVFAVTLLSTLLALSIPLSLRSMIDECIPQKDYQAILVISLVVSTLLLMRYAGEWYKEVAAFSVVEKMIMAMRVAAYTQVQTFPLMHITRTPVGEWVSRIISDTDAVRRFLVVVSTDVIPSCILFVSLLVMLGMMNIWLLGAALILYPLWIMVYWRVNVQMKETSRTVRQQSGQLSSLVGAMIQGIRVIKGYGTFREEQERFHQAHRVYYDAACAQQRVQSVFWLTAQAVTAVGGVVVLMVGSLMVIAETVTIGELMAFYTCLGMCIEPCVRLVGIHAYGAEARSALERVHALSSNAHALCDRIVVSTGVRLHIAGDLRFQGVSFCYESGKKVLDDVMVHINAGDKVALVGRNGSGKTTFINILLGLYQPQKGRVLIDEKDLSTLDLHAYRRSLGLIVQDDFVFMGTVRDTIRYGVEQASAEDVVAAATYARIHEFIMKLPQQYDTILDERGNNISGGERQRLLLARALVRKPHVLIADEAFSAVDYVTETDFYDDIVGLFPERTMLFVSHRPQVLRIATKILFFNEGRVKTYHAYRELQEEWPFWADTIRVEN